MKKLILLLSVLIALISATSCHHDQSNASLKATQTDPTNTSSYGSLIDLVHSDTAAMWHENLDSIWEKALPQDTTDKVQYFTVRSQDLLWGMGLDTSNKGLDSMLKKYSIAIGNDSVRRFVRITLGYDNIQKRLKAFIQPVYDVQMVGDSIANAGTACYFDSNGKIICNGLGLPGSHLKSEKLAGSNNSYVGDLNSPCPPICGSAPTN
ncbi:hypothetical protein [Chitinophaga sancti]|uniref:Uncharacterized protein n=1 Tax=Chitinophaga sancti TaxID=1004 RepID=A0A1K1R4G4_9BACT|nr:hypothetical protein [Chitinophaga sancti]WQD64287.1 hypothetical protein U0033_07760 [Chitinophaga sancti]WQG90089.1 hypothetical protein SR876_01160 [Chitinophaga sancti]SFW66747.1 hypothetical protein SAMN05661012_03356 [Chitinophaga sancti]